MQTETAKLGRGQVEALQTLQAAVLNAIERLSAKLDARENNDLREAPATPELDLEVDVPNLPVLWRTNQAEAVQLISFGTPDRSVEVIATVRLARQDPRNIPHNLWLILFPNVTIWNKSERRRVSLQFEFRTTIKGPRPHMEIAGNTPAMAASELQAISRRAQIPVTLEEHGPGRAASQIPGVLSADQAQLPFLRGPLAIDALTHAQGVLAFFYQQLDQQDAPVDLFKGTLIIRDRLSGKSMSIDLEKLIERVQSKK
jgi:hypothetical protein